MKISLLLKDVDISSAGRQEIEDRLRLALTRFSPPIRGLTVTLGDENGEKGGIDKSCRLVIDLPGGNVVVNEQGSSILAAVGQAAERAARAVVRRVERSRDLRRSSQPGGNAGPD